MKENDGVRSASPARRSALALAVMAFVAAGCGPANNAAPSEPPPPEVMVEEAQAQSITVVNELPGRTAAFRMAEVRPQVNGIVERRLFREGSDVEVGEQLYQIDDATYQAAHKKAIANLRTAELQAKRYAELSKVQAVSRQAHDDAQAAYRQARAEADLAEINLEYTKVRSPISGRIGRSAVSEGALVTNGQPNAMATVQQLDPIYVDMTQSSVELMALRKALEAGSIRRDGDDSAVVRLRLEDGSVYEHEGVLQFSEVEVSPGTGSVTLRAQFPNPDRKLLPGMFVHALVDSGRRDDVYLVPNQAVMLGNGSSTVYVVDAENRVEPRRVVNERMVDNKWMITDGLEDGDRIIVEGRQKVRPGATVQLAQAAAPEGATEAAEDAPAQTAAAAPQTPNTPDAQ